jgi:hypothetical protein
VNDPLLALFGTSALELFTGRKFVVTHGALERFPAFMRQGPLATVDALCRHYTGPLEVAQGTAENGIQVPVRDVHATALLKLGLTVYFTDLRRSLSEARPWLKALEDALGLPECTSLAAFTNAAGSGLAWHHDRFDQLFFQLRGKKGFRHTRNRYVTEPDVQFSPFAAALPEFAPTYRHGFPAASEELARDVETVELTPGSAFFMPAGTWHTTAAQTEESLSLVVVVRAPSRLDLALNFLRYYASQAPEFRARVYGGFASEGAERDAEHGALRALFADLGRRLPELDPEHAFGAWISHGYTLGTIGEYPRQTPFERFIRLPNSSVRFEPAEHAARLSVIVLSGPTSRPQARTQLALNVEARGVIEWILATNRAFTLSEAAERFPDFSRDDLADLCGWLSHAALIRPLPAPEWDGGRL